MEAGQALAHPSGPPLGPYNKQRDRLLRKAVAQANGVLGFADDVWGSRWAPPELQAWTAGTPVRWQALKPPKDDPDPKAVACYGIRRADTQEVLVRFVEGRPVSPVTTAVLGWVCERLRAEGKAALRLIWDHARGPLSQEVQAWLHQHNRQAKRTGDGRLLVCRLPIKSPWLNRIEPQGVHAKRAVVEPDRILTTAELIERIGASWNCQYIEPLHQIIAQKVA